MILCSMKNEEQNTGKGGWQEQIHGLLFGDRLSWQAIIYDLINTEQLDPWDINIGFLVNKYLEKVRALEEANFFVSGKVLLAASFLLRLKSEILLNEYIPSLDDILFGKKEEKKYVQERIELEDEIPELIPRTPLPRGRKVTLQELMTALGKAISTETRRIHRVVIERQRAFETGAVLPRRTIDLKDQIRKLYSMLKGIFSKKEIEKIAFSSFSGKNSDEKLSQFVPLLYLDYQHKIIAEQEVPFDEIWVWLKEVYEKKHADILEAMRKESEDAMQKDLIEEAKNGPSEKEEKSGKKKRKSGKFKKNEEMEEVVEEEREENAGDAQRKENNSLENTNI